jgi:hypothetical protein
VSIKCPLMSRNMVIADDARLAAQLSCVLSETGRYVPVIEGPRMSRADRDAEIARRNNAASRVKPEAIFLAGLTDDTVAALTARFTPRLRLRLRRIVTLEDINALHDGRTTSIPLHWGNDRIGIGLLKALRTKTTIAFEDHPSPIENVPAKSAHLVVCEDGDELSQVIAANYAFALRAGLFLIQEVDGAITDGLLEAFYSVYDQTEVSQTEALQRLQARLRQLSARCLCRRMGRSPSSPAVSLLGLPSRRPCRPICSDTPISARQS